MARAKKSTAVIAPNKGLRYDRPAIGLDERELQEGLNFRVKEGKLTNLNLGWTLFGDFQLNGPVRMIDNFFIRGGSEQLIFATLTDLYRYDTGTGGVWFITPVYVTGTVEVVGTVIDMTGGTNLGNMTNGGGINAAFDGDTTQNAGVGAQRSTQTDAFVGRTPTAPSAVSKAVVSGSDNAGFVTAITPLVTLTLYGKNGSAPASATDGTLLGTLTAFTDTADESAGRTVITSNTTVWDHMWVRVQHDGAANHMHVAEVVFYDRDGTAVVGVGTNWDPNLDNGDAIYFGANDQNDPAATWYTIATRNSDTSLTLTAAATTVAAGTAYTARRLFTGDADDIWSYDTFVNAAGTEDRWYATNGVDDVVRWNGTDDFATLLESLGFTAVKALTVFENMMIFANFVQGGVQKPVDIINSDVGDPEDVSSGISEQFTVHAHPSYISAVYPLGDILVIYSQRVLSVAQFVGDPFIFTFRTVATGVGPISTNSVADFGDYHLFTGFDAQYRFDGITLEEYGMRVWREVVRRSDPLRRAMAFAHFDEENGDLIWVVPLVTDAEASTTGGQPERAYVLHYLEEMDVASTPLPHSQRETPFTASGFFTRDTGLTWADLTDEWHNLSFRWNDKFFAAAFPLNLFGDGDGFVYTLNTSQDKPNGDPLETFVRFGRKATGDGRMRGLIRRVYPFVEVAGTPLNVTTRLTDHAMGPITTTQTDEFDQSLPEGGHFVSPFRRGRFVEMEFGTFDRGAIWSLSGYDLDITAGGRR